MKREFATLLFVMFSLYFINTIWAKDNDCPNGILPQSALVKKINSKKEIGENGITSESSITKLVNTTDKCFKIAYSEFVYLIDKDQAIYMITTDDYFNPLVMIDFHNSPAKLNTFKGVVKGVGKYTYKNNRGLHKSIPYMIVVR